MLKRVYHSKNWSLNSLLHFDVEIFNPHKEDYELVAGVDCKTVGETFASTNHIDKEWWENKNVFLVKESRSTSVGDVVEDENGDVWLCCGCGWKQVSWNKSLKADDPWWNLMGEKYNDLYALNEIEKI